jgi:predicted DNA-binding transcriptional regulator YafY
MKLERLIGIIMILLHERNVTTKMLSQRFLVSVRTIQRDIDILSAAGIPIISSRGSAGGYSLLDSFTLKSVFLKKDEMKILTDLLGGLEKLLQQAGITNIKEKIGAIRGKNAYLDMGIIRFDFMPWLPQYELQERIVCISDAITNNNVIEVHYRDQDGLLTYRELEPYQLVMKDYAWYLYGYCLIRNDFRYFKLTRIEHLSKMDKVFEPRNFSIENPFNELKNNLIKIKLKFNTNAIGRLEDYFPRQDINYLKDYILVETNYPEDSWLYRTLLSFGKDVEVIEPIYMRDKLQTEIKTMLNIYSE